MENAKYRMENVKYRMRNGKRKMRGFTMVKSDGLRGGK